MLFLFSGDRRDDLTGERIEDFIGETVDAENANVAAFAGDF